MTSDTDTPQARLRAYAATLEWHYEPIEDLADDLREHAKGQGLQVTGEEIGTIAAEIIVETQANNLLRAGYADEGEIVEELTELVEGAEVEYDPDAIERTVERLWAARLEEQRGWPEVTDNDRLERAFIRLWRSGIVAEENFTCCQTCGVSEIGGEVPEGTAMDGYAFFHQQDTESAVDGGPLLLAYGTFTDETDPAGATEIGERVVAALDAEGLRTEWDGSHKKRIEVTLNWRRRLPA
ncbi:hypothetical protein GCM10023085_27210 [Actinomadura viridis]|uniref:DUF6891 domain-containing protein n=1 Tax=Actinomadura viridis TaxID=58110 RepID=A0A931DDR6_9ACTN|nr:hypothetical protein [Actinomadura viridis]MBG6087292.1 hypothetical protein [Actinomadura viridis]